MGGWLELGQRRLGQASWGALGAPSGHRYQAPSPAGLREATTSIRPPDPQDSEADLLQGEGCS